MYNWAFKLQQYIVYRLNNDLEMLRQIFSLAEPSIIIQKEQMKPVAPTAVLCKHFELGY